MQKIMKRTGIMSLLILVTAMVCACGGTGTGNTGNGSGLRQAESFAGESAADAQVDFEVLREKNPDIFASTKTIMLMEKKMTQALCISNLQI